MSANAPNTIDDERHAPQPVATLRRREQEPPDGLQTSSDLVMKNALVLMSAGSIVAFAIWLIT